MTDKPKITVDMEVHTRVDPSSTGTVVTRRSGKEINIIQTFVVPGNYLSPGNILVHRVSNKTFMVLCENSLGYTLRDNSNDKEHTADLRTLKQSCWLLVEKGG